MWKSKSVRCLVAGLLIISVLMGGGCGMFNKPPVINSLTPSATTVARGESCTISCSATDPDADDVLSYAWSVTGGALSGEGDTVTWTAPDTEGSYTISVTVSDDSEESASDSCTIEVVNNSPVVASIVPSATNVAPGESCTINCDAVFLNHNGAENVTLKRVGSPVLLKQVCVWFNTSIGLDSYSLIRLAFNSFYSNYLGKNY